MSAQDLAAAPLNLPWVARMVRPQTDCGVGERAPFVRQTFTLDVVPADAELRISAQGLYRCFINGQRVGQDLLTPGWTSYQDRLSFQTYPVGSLLKSGENTIDIWLGDGWHRSQMLWKKIALTNTWGDRLGAIAEIRSGQSLLLATDATWLSGLLPITKNGIYLGEEYDAREEVLSITGACTVDETFPLATLIPHETSAVQELAPLSPTRHFFDAESRSVYDFGQNIGGYVAFTVEGPRGATVVVQHAEILDANGVFDNTNYRTARAELHYTLQGGGQERYRPHFTFQGFRYARVTLPAGVRLLTIEAVPISSATRRTGWLHTGHTLVNRLVENTAWSQRGNFIEVPTDCPQRDERLGWTGDAQVFAPTACFLFESHSFWVKWLRDVMADQRADGAIAHFSPDPTRGHEDVAKGFFGSTGWGDAICLVPWTLWTHYGDRAILQETYPAMRRWIDFVWSISDGPIVQPPRQWGERGFTFGDWLQPGGPTEKPVPTLGDDAAATVYLYLSTALTARIAGLLGHEADAALLAERAAQIKTAFQHEFIAPSGRLVYDDQSSYALAIVHDLIPPALLPAARRHFKATIARAEGRIGTGFIGTPALLPALVKLGEPELAAAVFLQEEVPGWLYQVKRGATTIWERWDAIRADGSVFDPAMNSYNHYAYGAVCQWLFEGVAGLKPDPEQPAFRHVLLSPVIIPALSPVQAAHDSLNGRIEVGWSVDGDAVRYEATLPPGCTGTLQLGADHADLMVDGQAVATGRADLAPGPHQITFRLVR
ncbi:alpha-L-rhamnosidase [Sphaerotilus sp.]|uniref:alpha-L-rhamnosidase n=1 Tax=Sphaerotilus sp. TaxID=2093942 RepID=UPI002ACE199A|nr:family 78 glycoside hydrolase catalytic domain [Sphaerotilus sp.]MDZ7854638.1 family 78 glycoside hydrolase catalytic domain [Sphaerotilus sp.]